MREPEKTESPAEPTAEDEEWLLQQKEGERVHLIDERERKKEKAEAKKSLEELKEKLDSKQKELKLD